MIKFTKFINFVKVGGRLGLEDLACFLVSTVACPALMAIGRVRSDSLISLSRKVFSFV